MKNIIKIIGIAALLLLPIKTHAAALSMNPASANLTEGCENTVNIMVDTQGAETRGADAFLSYNPNEIEVLSILPGEMYKSYPGKIISNGNIFITAFSENGFFVGNGTLARLVFKSKPGVKSTTIRFKYAYGSTVDSNVAGRGAEDILSSVASGTYTFEPGICGTAPIKPAAPPADTTPPRVDKLRPGIGWENMVPNTDLSFELIDDGIGVNLDSFQVELDGVSYNREGPNRFNYEGGNKKYNITINPEEDFRKGEGEKIPVSIRAEDLNRNLLSLTYTFTVYSIPECPECLHAAAEPITKYSPGARVMLLILLFLVIVLYFVNIWLFTEPPIREEVPAKPKRKKSLKRKNR
ncbi:hypothetical protein JW752_00065 [Candidatus Peregrinibacteria bacterium]|nr:hypothetical protein [Candidatus Peregrinibacteria bacterium]